MQKIKHFLFWCLLIGTLASCSKDDSDQDANPNNALDYMPLTAGSTWNYGGSMPYTVTSTGKTQQINGKTFFEFETKTGSTVNKSYFSKQNGEYTAIGFVTTATGTPVSGQIEMTMIKENVSIGTSWQQSEVVNGINQTVTSTLIATGLTKTVNNKEYKDVIQVKSVTSIIVSGQTISAPEVNYFFAKGIGLILTDAGATAQIPLLSYEIK